MISFQFGFTKSLTFDATLNDSDVHSRSQGQENAKLSAFIFLQFSNHVDEIQSVSETPCCDGLHTILLNLTLNVLFHTTSHEP